MGHTSTYRDYLSDEITKLHELNQVVDLLVVTHIDNDHIAGAISFLHQIKKDNNPELVKQIWHNSYRHLSLANVDKSSNEDMNVLIAFRNLLEQHYENIDDTEISAKQGSTLAGLIYALGIRWNLHASIPICLGTRNDVGDLAITVLTPNQYQLKKLKKLWRSELLKLKIDFQFGKDEILDDAYEFYLLNEVDETTPNQNISYEENRCLFEELLKENLILDFGRDTSITNAASISMIIEECGKRILLTGDANDEDLYEALDELKANGDTLQFDLIKLSHHGSIHNNSAWLGLVYAKYYVISTDGSKHNHPDLETIINVILSNNEKSTVLCFNNDLTLIDVINDSELKEKYNYDVMKPNNDWGVEIEL